MRGSTSGARHLVFFVLFFYCACMLHDSWPECRVGNCGACEKSFGQFGSDLGVYMPDE